MLRTLPAALALTVTISPAIAQEVTDFTLPNGLEVVVIEDHRAPVVTNMVWYRTGSADEKAGESGVAHFLEHLMFQGTDRMAPGEFSATVSALGGTDNAFTSYDYTAYFQRVASEHLDRMMDMEADRMQGLTLTQPIVDNERSVILQERSQRTDSNPGALFREQMSAAQYLNSPYRRPVIGWRAEMEELSREDALDHYRTFYAPNNAILVVAGDVEPDAVRQMAEAHFGPLIPSDTIPPRARPQEPPQIAARHLTFADPRVAQPYVLRTYLAPERTSGAQQDAAALTVLAQILGGDPTTSVLAQALQFGEAPRAIHTMAGYDGVAVDATTFTLGIVPAPDITLEEAEAALDGALQTFLANGVDVAQLDRIKRQIRAADIYDRDDASGLANRYGAALAVGLTVQDVQDWPATLEAVTAEDVMAAARDVLDPRRSVTGWLMPEAPTEETAE
ncbi:M16 family metallopeptidase [Falsirhodobacter halotolerans]|uniref:M16 family metallopeptidase n=1 Tax=Falsirhodobacter halotolerans TaxID=1146892 RepID=UPI001FD34FFA|nr:pitrilysin family protein [Falsirhodobacter halotolerans]MCJ8140727.1 insulinase family protein [Falsirhodobacter halotolerans]